MYIFGGIFLYLFTYFVQNNSTIDSKKIFLTQEWLVVENCPTPPWIAFLMLYQLVYDIRSHFNEPILPWITYERQAARRVRPSRNEYNLVRNLLTVTTG